MKVSSDLVIHLIVFLFFTILIYGQGRFNSKNSRLVKKMTLSIGNFFSKDLAEEVIRIIYLILVSIGIFLFLFFNSHVFLRKLFMDMSVNNFIVIFIAFIAFIQILFLIVTVIYLIFLKRDINKIIENIDWIKVNLNMFIYTGYIRPLGIAIFETIFFFNSMFIILNEKFNLSLALSMFLTIAYYCFGKFLLRKNKDKQLIFTILGLSIALTTLSLINAVDSLIVGFIFMYVILVMIAFKDVKVKF